MWSGELAGQWCFRLRDKIRSPNFVFRNSRQGEVTWHGTPSCCTSTVSSLLGLSQKVTCYFEEVQGRFYHSLIPETKQQEGISHPRFLSRSCISRHGVCADSIILPMMSLRRYKHILISPYYFLEPLFWELKPWLCKLIAVIQYGREREGSSPRNPIGLSWQILIKILRTVP